MAAIEHQNAATRGLIDGRFAEVNDGAFGQATTVDPAFTIVGRFPAHTKEGLSAIGLGRGFAGQQKADIGWDQQGDTKQIPPFVQVLG